MTTGAEVLQCPIEIRIFHVLLAVIMKTASLHCGRISPLLKNSKKKHNHINCEYGQCAIIVMQAEFGERFRKKNKSPVIPPPLRTAILFI